MPDELTHGSWFSGIGGMDAGFERAGFRTAFHSEVDPFANTILERHWPEIPNLGCIRGVRARQLHVDTLRAGRFVCPLDSPAGPEERDADRRIEGGGDAGDRGERGPADGDGGAIRDRRPRGLDATGGDQPNAWSGWAERGWSTAAGDLLGSADVWTGGFPCQGLSVAGKRAGLADPRSGLALAFLELAREYRPPWIVLENVPGLLSSNQGRDFAVLLDLLEDIGYADIAWRVLDARYFGVAQRRRRVLLVASHRANGAREVLFEPDSGSGDHPPGWETRTHATRRSTDGAAGSDIAGPLTVGDHVGIQPNGQDAWTGQLVVGTIAPTLNSNRQGGWRYDADQAEGLIAFTGRTRPESISPTLRVGGRDSAHTAGSSVDNTPHVVIPDGYGGGGVDADAVEANAREVLQRMQREIGAQAFEQWLTRGPDIFQSPEVLRSVVYGEGLRPKGSAGRGVDDGSLSREEDEVAWTMRVVRHVEAYGDTSSERELARQRAGELGEALSKLPQPRARAATLLRALRSTTQGAGTVQSSLPATTEGSLETVRRLTPLECERLQGFSDGWTIPREWRGKTYTHHVGPRPDPGPGPLVYRKSQRAREVDGEESWRDAEVANTLNVFDIGSRDTHAIMSSVEEDPRLPKGIDSPRYRVLGNAVCVPVAEWIASRIRAVELDT